MSSEMQGLIVLGSLFTGMLMGGLGLLIAWNKKPFRTYSRRRVGEVIFAVGVILCLGAVILLAFPGGL